MPPQARAVDWDSSVSNQTQETAASQQSSPPETGQGEVEAAPGATESIAPARAGAEAVAARAVVDTATQLRDIGEASYGVPEVLPETVHGSDERVQVQQTHLYPWRVHASLRITAADGSAWRTRRSRPWNSWISRDA